MALLDDDFQGYSIGTNAPFGSFTGGGSPAVIVAGGLLIPGNDRHFELTLGTVEYVHASYITSFTQYLATYLPATSNRQEFYAVTNGPNGGGQSFTLLQLRIEVDGTLTAVCPVSGETLANSGDFVTPFYSVNFFQVNVTLSDVLVSGVLHLNIACEIWLNGVSIMAFNTTTSATVAGLTNGTAEANRFQMIGGTYGHFTLDTLQAAASYPHAGSPVAIAYQSVIEVDELPDTALVDVLQAVIEIDELPDTTELQVFQMVIEVDLKPNNVWYLSES